LPAAATLTLRAALTGFAFEIRIYSKLVRAAGIEAD